MKHRFLLIVALVALTLGSFAARVEIREARSLALRYFAQTTQTDAASLRISQEFITTGRTGEAYYIFNLSEGGFIIFSAEDTYVPVIGYSARGQYNPNRLPQGYDGFMQNYTDQIDFLRENTTDQTSEIAASWQSLRNNTPLPKSGEKGVQPLLIGTWNQDDPYNYHCPADEAGPGGYCYSGCVATAMSQIMYYWRWPNQGQGSSSYYHINYGTLSANYGATQYHFDGMVHNSDSKYNYFDAELQYQAGVSVRMDYAPDGSGAFSYNVPAAMVNYFKYSNSTTYLEKQNYSQSVWESKIKADVDLGRPIYYSGRDASNGGHAFVLNGYNDQTPTLYYFNFGWSGSGDGWYTINDVGGFYNDQAMVYQMIPAAGYPAYPAATNEINFTEGTIEDGSGPIADYQNSSDYKWLISPQTAEDSVTKIVISSKRFDLGAGDEIKIYDGADVNAPLLATFSLTTPPSDITTTGNKALVHFTSDGSSVGNGFLLEYSSIQPNYCAGTKTYTEVSGLFDDGSGDFYYKANTNCNFKIQPQYASEITLYFNYFSTDDAEDYLKIINNSNSQTLATLSGNYTTPPAPITVTGGKVYMMWRSNGWKQKPGWEVRWETLNVGAESRELLSGFQLWPNPAQSVFNVAFDVDQSQAFQIKLVDLTGETIFNDQATAFAGRYETKIDVSKLARGIYFLNITGDRGTYTRKVVVK